MNSSNDRFVPKIHPTTRPVEPDDPMTLYATPIAGDPEVMLRCLVQEYAGMGWDAEHMVALFRDPYYPVLHELWRRFGEVGIREQIAAVLSQTGVFCCEGAALDEAGPTEPELVQIGLPTQWRGVRSESPERPGGTSHA